MTKNVSIRSQHELEEKLGALQVIFGRTEDVYTAFSLSEPLFCYDGNSLPELENRVSDTLRSYARVFYGVDLKVDAHVVGDHLLPVEHFEKLSTIQTSFTPVLEAA